MFAYQWSTVLQYLPEFLQGAWYTIAISVMAYLLALVLAVCAALGRRSGQRWVRWIAGIYIETVRNTPVLLQIFVVFFALPSVGLRLSGFWAGVVALGVNVGAYLAEVFRAGMSAVPQGQLEASAILGISRWDAFWRIVFPQTVRTVFPTLVNYAILTVLGTSLLSALAVPELTGVALVVNARTLLFVQVFLLLLSFYLAISALISVLGAAIGKRAFKPPLPPRQRRAGLGEAFRKRVRPKAMAQ